MNEANITYRAAEKSDCPDIASLFSMASDGVANYVWTSHTEPGESILDVGIRRYMREDTVFSYKNCLIASVTGEVAGMMLAYPMIVEKDLDESKVDPVLLPYVRLEEDNSFYISSMAVFPEYRKMGIATGFLKLAEDKARERGIDKTSLIVFDENTRARDLYLARGYIEVKREAVVPHDLILHRGNALLMVKTLG
jgi:ribosomal protein S18 acetylase RimI-like enzyme